MTIIVVTDVFDVEFQFDNASGNLSFTPLILGNNERLYGNTLGGGANGFGTLFEFDPITNNFVILHNFDNNTTGRSPGSLTQATNGKIYGSTALGGINGKGIVYSYDLTNSVLTIELEFIEGGF